MIKKLDCVICSKYRKIEKPKMSYLIKKTILLFAVSIKMKNKKYLEKKNQLKY